jgi:hypothetical protein
MDGIKLNEYKKVWSDKITTLIKYRNELTTNELYWTNICNHALERFGELTRLQSKTLNNIYQRFVNNNG